jgi:hypothetical protein
MHNKASQRETIVNSFIVSLKRLNKKKISTTFFIRVWQKVKPQKHSKLYNRCASHRNKAFLPVFSFSYILKIDRKRAKDSKRKSSFFDKDSFSKRKYQQKLKTDVALNKANLKLKYFLFILLCSYSISRNI